MVTPCPWCAEVALHSFLSLENPQMRILRGSQLYTLLDPRNGIHLSWTIVTHLEMESLLGPLTPLTDLLLTLTLMNLGIISIGQAKFSVSYSSHHITPLSTTKANKHVCTKDTPDCEKLRPYFGWVNVDTVHKPLNSPLNGESTSPTHFL